jgi:hypothetical protein
VRYYDEVRTPLSLHQIQGDSEYQLHVLRVRPRRSAYRAG